MCLILLFVTLILTSSVCFVRCDSSEPSKGIQILILYNETDEVTYCKSYSENYFTEKQLIYITYDGTGSGVSDVIAARCHKKYNDTHTFPAPVMKPYYFWPPQNVVVEVDMATIWTCRFKDNDKKRFSCDFPVYVRCQNTPKVSINKEMLKTVIPHYSVTEYDAESRYEYRDDELAQITCNSDAGSGIKFRVNDNNNDSLILPTDYIYDTKSINLRAVLNKKYNLSHIDCVVRRTDTLDSVHRIFMEPKRYDGYKNELTIRINGLTLAPGSDKKTVYYNYVKGEIFNVTCENPNDSSNHLEISFGDEIKRNVTHDGSNIVSASIDTNEYNKIDKPLVTCGGSMYYDKKLYLIVADLKNGVMIHGMTRRKIIFEYTNEIYANIFIYEYEDNELFKLKWDFGESRAHAYDKMRTHVLLTWKDTLLDNSERVISPISSNVITTVMTRLSPDDDGVIIKCLIRSSWNYYESWIVLRRKIVTEEESALSNNALLSTRTIIMIAVTGGVSIFIIVLLLCVIYKYYYQKRKALLNETGEVNEDDGVITRTSQFPEQWDDYANKMIKGTQPSTSYIDPKYTCTYATPIPKNLWQVKDQAVLRVNSLYESCEDGGDRSNQKLDEQKNTLKYQNLDRYVNLSDNSYINFERPNYEMETYSEVPASSLRG